MDFAPEREHIHELANHLTIIQGAVKKVIRSIDEKKLDMSDEKDRLVKADDYLKKSVLALRSLREELEVKIQSVGSKH